MNFSIAIILIVFFILILGGVIGVTIYFVVKTSNSSSDPKPSNQNIKHLNESKVTQGIVLFMEYNPMQFILSGISPKAEINSKIYNIKWGANEISLDEGDYTLNAFFPYLAMDRCCEGSIGFTLKKNEVKKIKYTAPLTMVQKGTVIFLK
tara:strand:- start:200 stop:649 length:450 start_codon:yes stop_codon:yes gene_type:complete